MPSSPIVRRQTEIGYRGAIIAAVAVAAFGCHVTPASERLAQARQLSADLLVQFTKAADAANRAVMADTDDASVSFAREADQASQSVHASTDALKPLLEDLRYSEEARLLQDLNAQIVALSRRNTNVRSLALALNEKGKLTAACEDSLRAIREALAQRGFIGTR